jgi:TonB-dependent SusC/RagA subfamily outer membrane receptor
VRSALLAIFLTLSPVALAAQMTVSGRVTVGDRPIQGVTVGIPSLDVESRTNADGVFNFLVRAAQVRGQTVELVARHRRFGTRSVQIQLTGGSLVHNFALSGERPSPADRPLPGPDQPTRTAPAPITDVPTSAVSRHTVDSTAFAELAGASDVTNALAGRIPGLLVTSAQTPGGASLMVHRAPRSFSGSLQPLIVVDGVPLDNTSVPSGPAQQFGLGGFDYGSPLSNLALDDIATVTLLATAEATPLYGSRAANGVLVITTKRPHGGSAGVQYAARARFSGHSPTRLPAYQSRFGQGLGGQFEFFDGQGGGTHDDVDQSWGPPLDGQPIAQASLTEARRPDVRHWLPRASGVRDYFDGGRSIDANASIQGSRGGSSGRASVTASDVRGLTPNATARRLGIALQGAAQPTSRLTATANMQVISNSAEERPGTGFDEINPVAGFTRLGRQVDLDALRGSIRDANNEQLNWIYTARNNPFFQTVENSNDDKRAHVIGGARLAYAFTPAFGATLHAGTSDLRERRNYEVAEGWRSGYPTALGRADFSGSGAQAQRLTANDRIMGVSFNGVAPLSALNLMATAGFEARTSEFETRTTVITGASAGRPGSVVTDTQAGSHDVNAVFLTAALSRGAWLTLHGGARIEQSSSFSDALGSAVFPSFSVSYDAAQKIAAIRALGLGAARLRASWWRAGNEVTARSLTGAFTGGAAASPAVGFPVSDAVPERTTGVELSSELATPGNRLALDFTVYRERSSELFVGTLSVQSAEVFNSGFELQLRAVPVSSVLGPRWDVAASFTRNTSTVDELGGGLTEVPLGPSLWGASLTARKGYPVGTIVGSRYLRDPTGVLLLSNGLPISDGSSSVLGSWQPAWATSLQSGLRFGGAEVALLFDARVGGKVFSATNLWGSYAGTLESTVVGRDGMTVAGIDRLTGSPNTTEVTAEEYFHSLATIHEAWVFSASYAKLREARLTYEVPLTFVPGLRGQVGRFSFMARNLFTIADAPNIDPETALSSTSFQGFEMGQLPSTRSVGFVLSITP